MSAAMTAAQALIKDMERASALIDSALTMSEYTSRCVALARLARQFLREGHDDASPAKEKPMKHFHVDGRPYQSQNALLTPMEIKAIADVPASHALYCTGRLAELGLPDAQPIEIEGQEFHSVPQAHP